ncbi:MAG TPA: hypothetical protein VGE52_21845 [Pirellulales bacterium]
MNGEEDGPRKEPTNPLGAPTPPAAPLPLAAPTSPASGTRRPPPPLPLAPPTPLDDFDPRSRRLDLVFGSLTGVALLAALPFCGLVLYTLGEERFAIDSAFNAGAAGALTAVPAVCGVWLGLHRLVDDPASDRWVRRPAWVPAMMWSLFLPVVAALSAPAAASLLISTSSVAWFIASMRGSMRVAFSEDDGDPAEFQCTIGQIAAATFAAAATFGVVRTVAAQPGPINGVSALLLVAATWVLADFIAAWLILAVDVHIVGWAASIGLSCVGGFILSFAERTPFAAGAGLLIAHSVVVCIALQIARSYHVRVVKSYVAQAADGPFGRDVSSGES